MPQLTITRGKETTDKLIQRAQYKWLLLFCTELDLKWQERTAFYPSKKNVKVQLDLVVCIIILQRISEELEFIFSLKFCIHHQEISMG